MSGEWRRDDCRFESVDGRIGFGESPEAAIIDCLGGEVSADWEASTDEQVLKAISPAGDLLGWCDPEWRAV